MKQLDAKEQLELFQRYKTTRDAKARDGLIMANTRLLRRKVSKMVRNDQRADLMQEAFIGVIHCLDKFDPNKGANWATYSAQWALAKQLRFLSKNLSSVSVAFSTRKGRKLFSLLHKYTTDADVVVVAQKKGMEVTVEEVARLRACKEITNSSELEEITTEPPVCDVFMKKHMQEVLTMVVIPTLTEKEKALLENIMGENIPLAQLAKKWGCSPQALFQNRDKLFRKLRPLLKKFM